MLGNRTQKWEQKWRQIHFSHQNHKIQNATINFFFSWIVNNFTTVACNANTNLSHIFSRSGISTENFAQILTCVGDLSLGRGSSLKVLTSKIVNLAALAASLIKFPGCYGDHPDSNTGLIPAPDFTNNWLTISPNCSLLNKLTEIT